MRSANKITKRRTFRWRSTAKEEHVAIAGDFTEWKPVPMRRRLDRTWVAVFSLAPGTHEYKFIVGDQWRTDPENSCLAANPYGSLNSAVVVE